MSYINGPRIMSNGLVLYLDSGNLKSYPAAGNNMFDLMGSASTGSLKNTPTFSGNNSGYIILDGIDDHILTTNLASNFGSSTIESHFTWFYPTAAGQIVSELGQSTINTGWHDSNIEISTGGLISFSTWHGSLSNKVVSSAVSFNTWYHLGFTYDGTTLVAYINGARIGTTSFSRQAPYNNGFGLYYGLGAIDGTNMGTYAYAAGRLASFMLYNTRLTDNDVLQNYNATKTRFGL